MKVRLEKEGRRLHLTAPFGELDPVRGVCVFLQLEGKLYPLKAVCTQKEQRKQNRETRKGQRSYLGA